MNDPSAKLAGLSTLLQLEKEIRSATDVHHFSFIAVNQTRRLITYRQAVLWRENREGFEPEAISGASTIEENAPFVVWIKKLMVLIGDKFDLQKTQTISLEDFSETVQQEWRQWMASYTLWLPLKTVNGGPRGGLWLLREEPWTENETRLLERLTDAYDYTWRFLVDQRLSRWRFVRGKHIVGMVVLLAIMILALPIRQSVLAPARIVAQDAHVVSAPMDGVVEKFFVQPNQAVKKGDLLFNLDPQELENNYQVALKTLAIAEAEYLKTAQKAFDDKESKSEVAMQRASVRRRQEEAKYLKELLERIEVRAERDGAAIFADPDDWIGRPVRIGERIMSIADPNAVEVEILMSSTDAMSVDSGTDMRLFLNVDPLHPLEGHVRYVAYEATPQPNATLAFQIKADLDLSKDVTPPRIGWQGTAKIYGHQSSIFYYLMRRPLSVIRRWTGI